MRQAPSDYEIFDFVISTRRKVIKYEGGQGDRRRLFAIESSVMGIDSLTLFNVDDISCSVEKCVSASLSLQIFITNLSIPKLKSLVTWKLFSRSLRTQVITQITFTSTFSYKCISNCCLCYETQILLPLLLLALFPIIFPVKADNVVCPWAS